MPTPKHLRPKQVMTGVGATGFSFDTSPEWLKRHFVKCLTSKGFAVVVRPGVPLWNDEFNPAHLAERR